MKKRVRVIKADYLLKDKIGSGHVSPEKIKECEKIIDELDYDFAPYAKDILDRLFTCVEKTRANEMALEEAKPEMTDLIMQIKATAPMCKYDLMGNLANIMLNFLESMETMDQHALEIVSAHHKTLATLINKDMRGDCGAIGEQFEKELTSACERYYKIKKTAANADEKTS